MECYTILRNIQDLLSMKGGSEYLLMAHLVHLGQW